MNFDPNGYPIPDPDAPKTTVGKIAAILWMLFCAGAFVYGLICIVGAIL